MESMSKLLKIGDLARRTGKSVRALHLYEELGLLTPTARSGSGVPALHRGGAREPTSRSGARDRRSSRACSSIPCLAALLTGSYPYAHVRVQGKEGPLGEFPH